jgi:hypothetical protein
MNSLSKFWSACQFERAPYVHPADMEVVARHPELFDTKIVSFKSFLRGDRFGRFDDHRFHLSLLPSPYGGNLDKADIYILLLNPGFSVADHFHLHESRRRKINMLRQALNGEQFPFVSLDPSLCWRPGFLWWEKKLRAVLITIAGAKDIPYIEAMRSLSQRLAVIELIPYHSGSFKAYKIIETLPSVQAARFYVQTTLLPKARRGDAVIIVTRKVREWGVGGKNVILYEDGETRGASMSPRSKGGVAILKRYGISWSGTKP